MCVLESCFTRSWHAQVEYSGHLYIVYYAILLAMVVAYSFAGTRQFDKCDKAFVKGFEGYRACPELKSSILNQLTFWW